MTEDIYSLKIRLEEFDRILNGKMDIKLAIAHPKRKSFAVGNRITLYVPDTEGEDKKVVDAEIVNLMFFSDFKEAVETLGKERCGFTNSTNSDKVYDEFLTSEKYEQIQKYGIMAIFFKQL